MTYSTRPQDQDRSHLLAQELLPWIVNGSATEEQRASVAQHLAQCADCQAELMLQEHIHAAMPLQPAGALPDVDAGLQRLMERIETDAMCDQPVPRAAAPAPRHRRFGRATYAIAAFALLQTVALTLVGLRLAAEEEPQYRMFSNAPADTAPAATPSATIRVVPDDRITLASWNAALAGAGLQVVGGPNTIGAYTLAPVPGTSGERALEQLRATAGMRLVETIGTTP
ncbi:anti-sigma factor family protein [Acidovorax sp. NCPPB 4044]|uniref:anti-sigma factor family protein n=1 Tax=Acidovorax sp. NCPPB 4044 TaxID=2940490 RepID=UPI002304A08F|nr:zf-HC2 domain-containing protein [Acidovorax sp. NCPPB 4044]MDA8521120.1 zf-HC2 domain-containing protein [Acidovorax sp. NCPPB 4044]